LRSRDGPHHHSQTQGRWRPPFSSSVPLSLGRRLQCRFLRGSLLGPARFRPLEPLNEISTHLTVSCLETSAARCNSATRAWMSSRWMASGPQVRVASAARTRVDAGLFGSTMTLPVVAAPRDICCNRDRLPKTSPARFPEAPGTLAPKSGWRLGPERLQHAPLRAIEGPAARSRAPRGGKVQSLTRAAPLSAMPTQASSTIRSWPSRRALSTTQ
jgi:hypothetical protein